MIGAEVTKTWEGIDGARAGAREPLLRRPRACGLACALTAAALLTFSPPAQAQKPLEIGVLALGPRNMPAWRCGPGAPRLASEEARRETKPFYITGLHGRAREAQIRREPAGAARQKRTSLRSRSADGHAAGGEGFRPGVRPEAGGRDRRGRHHGRARRPGGNPGPADPDGASRASATRSATASLRSLARPGGFITGVSHQQVQGSGKQDRAVQGDGSGFAAPDHHPSPRLRAG